MQGLGGGPCRWARPGLGQDDGDLHRPGELGGDGGPGPSGEPRAAPGQGQHSRQRGLGCEAVAVRAAQGAEGEESVRCGRPAGRRDAVGRVLRSADQGRRVGGGVEEAAAAVGEPVQDDVEQLTRPSVPALVSGHLVEGEQPLGEIGVVLEHPRRLRVGAPSQGDASEPPGARRPVQRQEVLGAGHGRGQQVGPGEQGARFGQACDREAVPGRDHLVVAGRTRAQVPGLARVPPCTAPTAPDRAGSVGSCSTEAPSSNVPCGVTRHSSATHSPSWGPRARVSWSGVQT